MSSFIPLEASEIWKGYTLPTAIADAFYLDNSTKQ